MIDVEKLSGAMLDAWVAKALGHSNIAIKDDVVQSFDPIDESWRQRRFSTEWTDGGPLVDMHHVHLDPAFSNGAWLAAPTEIIKTGFRAGWRAYRSDVEMVGETALIAAMRCFVAWKVGAEVPDGAPAMTDRTRISAIAWRCRGVLDPPENLAQAQEASCHGCAYLTTNTWNGETKFICGRAKQKGSTQLYEMLKCRTYTTIPGSSAMAVKEKMIGAIQSKDLKWHAEFERAIDRLTALGMSDPLGSALWRFKYLHERASYTRALYLLAKRGRERLRGKEADYVLALARGAIREWAIDSCLTCNGIGSIPGNNRIPIKCDTCRGHGVKYYSDEDRARNCGIHESAWNAGHTKNFNEIMICLSGATAAVGGRVRDLLKEGD